MKKLQYLQKQVYKNTWRKVLYFKFLIMQHITWIHRNQMTIASLESSISADNPIRFIDAFVDNIDLKALGFEMQTLKTEVRPSFDTIIFLKLYLYGYLNGLRNSRKVEKAFFIQMSFFQKKELTSNRRF